MPEQARTAILISGSGTNLQAFIDASKAGDLDLEIAVVFSNNPDAFGLKRAQDAGIPTVAIRHTDHPDRESFDSAIIAELDRYNPDLLVLAGFMRILSAPFVRHYTGRIINIHPALLPLYPGLDTHQRVLDAGDQWHGSTVHFVTEELDAGPRILQGRITVDPAESAEQLQRRVQSIEHRIYPEAANLVGTGKARFDNGNCLLDDKIAPEPVIKTFDSN